MRAVCLLLLTLTLPVSAAPVPRELRGGDDVRIVGVWRLEKARYGDGEYAGAVGTKWTLGAEGQAIRERPNEAPGTVVYKIDPKAAAKTFDWDGGSFPGVYELDGDTLRVALGGSVRPESCKPGEGVYFFEFRKVR